MRVIATSAGFYQGSRRKAGDIFDMADADMRKKDGKTVLPKWVKAVKDEADAKAEVAKAKKADEMKAKAAAVASSGGAAAAAKAATVAEQLAG